MKKSFDELPWNGKKDLSPHIPKKTPNTKTTSSSIKLEDKELAISAD